jgi:hypothetical protein
MVQESGLKRSYQILTHFPYQVYNFSAFECDWKERIHNLGEEMEKAYLFLNPPLTRLKETLEKIETQGMPCILLVDKDEKIRLSSMFTREQSLEIYGVDLKLVVIDSSLSDDILPLLKVESP